MTEYVINPFSTVRDIPTYVFNHLKKLQEFSHLYAFSLYSLYSVKSGVEVIAVRGSVGGINPCVRNESFDRACKVGLV